MSEQIRVLVVDCDPDYSNQMSEGLRSKDFEVLTAANVSQALVRVKESTKHLDVAVIGDLPGPQNRTEAIRLLRTLTPDTEVVLLNGAETGDILAVIPPGDQGHLLKTLDIERLAQAIQSEKLFNPVRHLGRVTRSILDIGTAIQSADKPPELFAKILQGIRALGYDRARIFLVDRKNNCLRGVAQVGGTKIPIDKVSLPLDKDNYHSHLMREKRPIIFRAGQYVDYNVDILGKQGLKEWAEVPLSSEGVVIGKITIDNKNSGRRLYQEDLDDLELFAAPAAAAIVRAQRTQEYKKSRDALVRAGQKINSARNKRELYITIWEQAQELLPRLDTMLVTEYDAVNDVVSFLSFHDQGHQDSIPSRPHGNGITEFVIRTKLPYLLSQGDEAFRKEHGLDQAETPGPPAYSALVVPMFLKDEVVGTINAMCNVPDYVYTNHHLEVLQAFANQVAICVENIRQIDEVEQLHRATEALARQTGFEASVQAIVTHAHKLIETDLTGLIIQDRSGILRRAETVEPISQLDQFENPRQQGGVTRWVINNRKPRVIHNTAEDNLVKDSIRIAGIKSMLAMPMIFENRVVGVLYAHSRTPRFFSPRDINLWSAFAAQAAGALNAALEEEQNVIWQNLDRELTTCDDLKLLDQLLTNHVRRAMRADLAVFYPFNPMSPQETLPGRCTVDGKIKGRWQNPRGGRGSKIYQRLRKLDDKLLVINDIDDSRERAVSNFSLREKIKSFLALRLDVVPEGQSQARIAGLLFVNYRERTQFDSADLVGLRLACDHAASSILRLRLQTALQELATLRNKQLRAVVDIFKAFRNQRDSQRLIRKIAKSIEETTDIDVLSILAYDSKEEQFIKRGEAGTNVQGYEWNVSHEIKHFFLHQHGPMLLPPSEGHKLTRGEDFVEREKIVSTVVYPLRAEGVSEGLLIAGYRTPREFTRDETEAIGIFADLAAMVMHEKQLRTEIQKKQRQLEIQTVLTWVSLVEDLWRHATIQNASSIRNYVGALNIRLKRLKGASSSEILKTIRRIDHLAEAIAKAPARVPEATEMQREIFPLLPVLREVARRERTALSLERRVRINIELHAEGIGHPDIRGFRRWLIYALEALVQNAHKAMPGGGTIKILGEINGGWAEVRIQDNGIGVPHGLRDILFKELPPKSKDRTGMGIGGLLVAAIAEQHKGTVELEKPGPGDTTILMRLPMAKGNKE